MGADGERWGKHGTSHCSGRCSCPAVWPQQRPFEPSTSLWTHTHTHLHTHRHTHARTCSSYTEKKQFHSITGFQDPCLLDVEDSLQGHLRGPRAAPHLLFLILMPLAPQLSLPSLLILPLNSERNPPSCRPEPPQCRYHTCPASLQPLCNVGLPRGHGLGHRILCSQHFTHNRTQRIFSQ